MANERSFGETMVLIGSIHSRVYSIVVSDDFSCLLNIDNASRQIEEGDAISVTSLVFYYGLVTPTVHWFLDDNKVDSVSFAGSDSRQRLLLR